MQQRRQFWKWVLSSPGKQVARSSTPCWKRSQVGVQKVNGGQIYAAETPVLEMGRILKTSSVL